MRAANTDAAAATTNTALAADALDSREGCDKHVRLAALGTTQPSGRRRIFIYIRRRKRNYACASYLKGKKEKKSMAMRLEQIVWGLMSRII